MFLQILLPLAGTLVCYVLVHAASILYRNLTSPLRGVDGPKNHSFIFGQLRATGADSYLTDKWREQFGSTFLFNGLFSISELHTADIQAINHIVSKPGIYQKAASMRASSEMLIGRGIISVELDEHKRHRRALNPAFGVKQVQDITEIFMEKAVQLRDMWAAQLAQQEGAACIEVMSWLRRVTLDVIGQAGFNYRFDALDSSGKPNELNDAFTDLLHSPHANRYAGFRAAQGIAPILRFMPGPGWKFIRAARQKMMAIATQIVLKSKADIMALEGEKNLNEKRDLLSTLLKANMSTTIPETQRLSDAEMVGQMLTFFFVGHETTSLATAWALHALSAHPPTQGKLREELLSMSTDNPTMEELNSLPYLEQVVRETMRVHAPVVHTQRMAMEDNLLPLSKPYIDKKGKSHNSLLIPAGQMIHIPILAINTDKDIWGEDAAEFKPERWEKIPDSTSAIPSIWANLLTFFTGPHSCVGIRFSLVEMKALLFTLVRAFEFEEAGPKGAIGRAVVGFLQRPAVLAKGPGSGLPLIVKAYNPQL
ncbi:cytochrome P450 [Mycena galopus ATCC 62051]|nr:cytochrome P450 [Mycena galopus ATCC 62051]